ncbi:hypothetical protein Tco_0860323 [Tanacetum coccineum]|uniref:Uncharacterized protein n=1 Tax=Tanacetum coccineum TaxID=301880 RepID=A0ABQ5BEL1_9ASTR
MEMTLLKEATPTSSASLMSHEASKHVMNFRTLDVGTKARAIAEVIIPLSLVLEANARYENCMAFTEDELSAIASRLGTPIMLDSYTSTMCIESWSCSGSYLHTIKVEYEWKPPRFGNCSVFVHDDSQCPKHVVYEVGATKGTQRQNVPSHVRKDTTQNDVFQVV